MKNLESEYLAYIYVVSTEDRAANSAAPCPATNDDEVLNESASSLDHPDLSDTLGNEIDEDLN